MQSKEKSMSNNHDCEKFETVLHVTVKDHDGNEEHFSKTTFLPFTPYIGLQILIDNSSSGNATDPIKSVIWNEWGNNFVCNVEWRYPPDSSGEEGYWSLESHIALAKADGWE